MSRLYPEQNRILAADDEEDYLLLYHEVFAKESPFNRQMDDAFEPSRRAHGSRCAFELSTCRSGEGALALVKEAIEERRPFSVAFLDICMPPGPDGIWTAKQIRQLDPLMEIVIVTGFSDYSPEAILAKIPPLHKLIYIQKPFRLKEIFHFSTVLSAKRYQEQVLLNINKTLEQQVAERTRELKRKNERLIQEINKGKQTELELRESQKKLQSLFSHLVTAQEEERKRISSDLHDDLGQILALLKLRIQSLQNRIVPEQTELIRECGEIVSYVNKIIDRVRRLSHDLSPAVLEDLGLAQALKSLANGHARHTQATVSIDIATIDRLLPSSSEVIIYRVFQEVFNNIQKHSDAQEVCIRAGREGDRLRFEIDDHGKGFDMAMITQKSPHERGLGLSSMNERIRMLGGQLTIDSCIGKGTRIAFSIPCP